MNRSLFTKVLSVGSVLSVLTVLSLPGSATARPVLTFSAGLNANYDNNVFEYSPQDESTFIYRFNQGINPKRFAAVHSLDDLVADITLRGDWSPRVIHAHTTTLGLSFTGHQYVANPTKSYLSAAAHARQYWARGAYAEASYVLIPHYLIRYYRALDGSAIYWPCAFAEYLVTLKANVPLGRVAELAPFGRYEIDSYVSPYQVYDTRAWRMGVDAGVAPVRFLNAGATYEYKSAQATGPAPDISYYQHDVAGSLEPHWGPFGLVIGYGQSWRYYTTTTAQDSTHAGRVDVVIAPSAKATVRLGSRVALVGSFGRESRSSTAPYRSDIDEVKNYTEWRAGLGIRLGGI
jgi:hypothetical protein